jgi:hypothetical protein
MRTPEKHSRKPVISTPTGSDVMTIEEAAEFLRCHPRTVKRNADALHNHETKLIKPMTPQAAAAFLGLDEKTITRWARKAYLPGHPLGEGKRKYWRFIESELSDWLAVQTNRDWAAKTEEGRAE